MRKWTLQLAAAASIAACTLPVASDEAAAVALGFTPVDSITTPGGTVLVDVVVRGLEDAEPDQIVAAFDLDVAFDPAVVTATDVLFGTGLGAPGSPTEVFEDFDLSTPGIVDFAALSLLPDAVLDGMQGDQVTLATLVFQASTEEWQTSLTFVPDSVFGIDVKGAENELLVFEPVGSGSIRVVPEPGTFLLLAGGLVAIASRGRAR